MSSTLATATSRPRFSHNTNSNTNYNNNNRKKNKSLRDRNRKRKADATEKAASALKTCTECLAHAPKYKCPKCREPYCSIACCRTHKSKDCSMAQDTTASTTTGTTTAIAMKKSKYLPSDLLTCDPVQNSQLQRTQNDDNEEDLEEGWKITKEMMDRMDKSDWLRKELQDGGLRQMIHQICTSSVNVTRFGSPRGMTFQQEMLMSLQTKYPNFAVFLDKLKVLTGVLERQSHQEEDESLRDWLEYATPDTMGPLALKLLPSRRAADIELPPIDTQTSSEEDDEEESSSAEESSDEECETSSSCS